MPKALDSYYARILLDIYEDFAQEAQRALQWISFSPHPLKAAELAEAMIIHPEYDGCLDEDDRTDPASIFEILPAGLITAVRGPLWNPHRGQDQLFIQLAHFSVKEYLTSDRVLNSPACKFHFGETTARITIATSCMAYLLFIGRSIANKDVDCPVNQSDPWSRENGVAEHGFVTGTKAVVEEFTLAKAAARFWPFQVQQLGTNSNESLNGFLLKFLQADAPGFLLWQLLICRTPLFLIERRDEIEARKLQLRRKILLEIELI